MLFRSTANALQQAGGIRATFGGTSNGTLLLKGNRFYLYLLALIVIFPAIAGSIAVLIYGAKMWFIAPVLAVVLVGVIAATYYHMMVRIRRSYFDV